MNGEAAHIDAPRATAADPVAVDSATEARFRGITVGALQLLPAAHVAPDATCAHALAASRAHHGQPVLVVDGSRATGYLDMVDLVAAEAAGSAETETVAALRRPFAGTRESPERPTTFYPITSETPLSEASVFLQSAPFALVTDTDATGVQNVLTSDDIAQYADRMGLDSAPTRLARRAEDEARKDRSLADFLHMLDDYSPLVRTQRGTTLTTDPRRGLGLLPGAVGLPVRRHTTVRSAPMRRVLTYRKRLLSLAAEKFVADISSDAFQYARIRTNAGPGRARTAGSSRVGCRYTCPV